MPPRQKRTRKRAEWRNGAIDTDVPGEVNLVVWKAPDELFSDRFEQH